MSQRSLPFLFLCGVLLAARGAAQDPSGRAPGASVMREAHGVARVDGVLWGAGARYKVRFDPGGFELHPALGRAAPRTMTLAFALDAIERGGAAVLRAPGDAEPREEGARVEYEHALSGGASVIERYDVRADGVEQSFVFAERPAGAGDLVVRGRVASELSARPGEHETLDLVAPGIGGVRFGAVTGVDALGRTARGALRYDGATIELVLPGAFVDAAAYPLVLDPLIGASFPIPGDGDYDEGDPDVAFDAGSSAYLVAWHRAYSASDYDVHAQLVSTSGALTGGLILIENVSDTLALNPTVANVRSSGRFLIAWEHKGAGGYDIKGRALSPQTATLSNAVVLAPHAADETDPDSCGERTTLDDDAFVVWERAGGGVFGAQVAVSAIGDPVPFGTVAVMADPRAFRPAIAKSFGLDGRALIVYNLQYSPSDIDVYMTLIDRNAGVLDGPQMLSGASDVENDPDVDGDGSAWLVAYAFRGVGEEDSEIHARRVGFAGVLAVDASSALTSDLVDQFVPAVAWVPGKAFVAWQETKGLYDTDVWAMGVDPKDCQTCESKVALDLSTTWDGEPELATQWSAGVSGDQILATWYSGTAGFLSLDDVDLKAHLLESFGGGVWQDLGGSCGGGGNALPTGSITAGNPYFSILLTGADPAATAGVLIVAQPGAPLSCGPCTVILPGSQFPVPLIGGSGSKTLPIPCDLVIVGAQIEAQWAVLPTSAAACSLFGHVGASSRLRLTIGS